MSVVMNRVAQVAAVVESLQRDRKLLCVTGRQLLCNPICGYM